MSYFGADCLVKAYILAEENRRYTESTGLLRGEGIIRPEPHIGPPCHEQTGYLDWVDIDDTIRYVVSKFAPRSGGQSGKTARKTKRKRHTLKTVARASAGTPPAPGTKPPSPAGTRRK